MHASRRFSTAVVPEGRDVPVLVHTPKNYTPANGGVGLALLYAHGGALAPIRKSHWPAPLGSATIEGSKEYIVHSSDSRFCQ